MVRQRDQAAGDKIAVQGVQHQPDPRGAVETGLGAAEQTAQEHAGQPHRDGNTIMAGPPLLPGHEGQLHQELAAVGHFEHTELEFAPAAAVARLGEPLQGLLDHAGHGDALALRTLGLEVTHQAAQAGHAGDVPHARADLADRHPLQQPLAAAGSRAENRVQDVVQGQHADRFAELVDHRGDLPLAPLHGLEGLGDRRTPGNISHRPGQRLQMLVGNERQARQADPSGRFVAVGLGQQQVTAFGHLSPEVRQRHRRTEEADPAPRTHQFVDADRRERDSPCSTVCSCSTRAASVVEKSTARSRSPTWR